MLYKERQIMYMPTIVSVGIYYAVICAYTRVMCILFPTNPRSLIDVDNEQVYGRTRTTLQRFEFINSINL